MCIAIFTLFSLLSPRFFGEGLVSSRSLTDNFGIYCKFKMEMNVPGRKRNNQHFADTAVSSEEIPSDEEDVKATDTVENFPEDVSRYCQPCLNAGKIASAEGFCSECEEYMCASCVKYHKNLKATKDHIVLHKDNVDESTIQKSTKKPVKSLQSGTDHGLSKVVHIGFICAGCDMDPIVGPRYECRKCYEKDFSDGVDLCQRCKDDNLHSQHNSFLRKIEEPTDFDMKALRKEIDKTDVRRGAKSTSKVEEVHDGIVCDGCKMYPIVGQRYKCEKCYKEHFFNGVDVCQACKDDNFHSHHNRFLKKLCPVKSAYNARSSSCQGRGNVVHQGFVCDGCQMRPIVGTRYKCQKCYDTNFYSGVDLCQRCKDNNVHIQHSSFMKKIEKTDSPLQTALEAVLFPLTSFQRYQRDAGKVHFGIICDGCGKNPIVGPRYKCRKCYDKSFFSGYDLCQDCKDNNLHSHHNRLLEKKV